MCTNLELQLQLMLELNLLKNGSLILQDFMNELQCDRSDLDTALIRSTLSAHPEMIGDLAFKAIEDLLMKKALPSVYAVYSAADFLIGEEVNLSNDILGHFDEYCNQIFYCTDLFFTLCEINRQYLLPYNAIPADIRIVLYRYENDVLTRTLLN